MRHRLPIRALSCLVVAVVLALAAWAGLASGTFVGFQRQASDSIFPRDRVDPAVVVVGIDARSIERVGAWPWPRATQAALVDRLAEAGARVVVLDIVHAPAGPDDDVLARSLGAADAVVAESVDVDDVGGRFPRVRHTVRPVPPVAASATVGHSAVTADPTDGLVRTVPLVVEQGRSLVPALSLAALARYLDVEPVPTVRPHGVQVGDRLVPTVAGSRLVVSYPPPMPLRSATDVLDGKVGRGSLAGAAVFVGLTDASSGDRVLTPIDRGRGQPGVLVHAAAFNTMLRRSYLAPESRGSVVVSVFLLALVVALAVQFLPLVLAAASVVVVGGGYLYAGFRLADDGRVVNFVHPLLAVALAVPIAGAVRYLLEARDRRRLTRLLGQYVPPDVGRALLRKDRAAELTHGASLVATVLFCDIRGFTALTAPLAPGEVRTLLDAYYEAVSQVILTHGGTVLRYVGDEVYAVFGAPLAIDDHAATAVTCAGAVQDGAGMLGADLVGLGLPPVRYGIGINTGELISTVVGSDLRRQYAVIGNAVNLGARLCALAGPGEVVISDATSRLLPDQDGWVAETVTLKGIEGTTTVHRSSVAEPRRVPTDESAGPLASEGYVPRGD